MTTIDPLPTRGRPPGPSLSNEAVQILRRNAFSALRGPNSRGAVPRSAFSAIDTSTVDRSVKRAFPGQKDRTPFDLASHHLSNHDGYFDSALRAVFEAVEQSFRETDEMGITLRVFLKANFLNACADEGFLPAFIVQGAACAHIESGGNGDPRQSDAAREIVAMRRLLIADETEGFVAGLAVALRRLRRRPRSCTMREIVLAATASTDGFVLLHRLQPELVDADFVTETLWNIIWGSTEPGLLDPPSASNALERELVEAALKVFSGGHLPSTDALAHDLGVPMAEAAALFSTDQALFQRCMDYAVGSSVETESIAVAVKGAELAAVRDLLIAITRQASATPLLIEVVKQEAEGGFCAEAHRHLAEALGQSDAVALDRSTANGVARMLIDAALQGNSGQPIWEAGLEAFTAQSGE